MSLMVKYENLKDGDVVVNSDGLIGTVRKTDAFPSSSVHVVLGAGDLTSASVHEVFEDIDLAYDELVLVLHREDR